MYVFHVKIQLFVTAKSVQVWIRIGMAPWIRIQFEVKCCILIRIRTDANTDPQHWFKSAFK
jgi:hypothetical protein